MFAVAKKTVQLDEQVVQANTKDWRDRVNTELDKRGRGARAALAKHLRISTGHLSETLGESDDPNEKRWTRHRQEIEDFLWPPLLPPTPDTLEVRKLLDGLQDADRDLLRVIKAMDRDEQRKLAESIIAMKKLKR